MQLDDDNLALRTRVSLRTLANDKEKVNAFLRAWKMIKELPVDNPNSFWAIAGYHGEPFKRRQVDPDEKKVWGGFCQHANVLFPTWHRFYVLRLEQALRTVCPDDDLSMPYWDQTSNESLNGGIPDILTKNEVTIDGKQQSNPLIDFILPREIGGENSDKYYYKPNNYKTARYPFSGIESPEEAHIIAQKHNELIVKNGVDPTKMLNQNILDYLNRGIPSKTNPSHISTCYLYKTCLDAPNYNGFSNTSSQKRYNCQSLEQPHNEIHLAIGGFTLDKREYGKISGANGDMGENETAAFDPIFFFHHCNIDRLFWIWQKRHGNTDHFDIDENDRKGTNPNSAKGQGYTPYEESNKQLSMDTILHPFQLPNGILATSKDCINIEKQLNYTYSIGSFDKKTYPTQLSPKKASVFYSVDSLDEVPKFMEDASESLPSIIICDVTNIIDWRIKDFPFFSENYPKEPFTVGGIEWSGNYIFRVENIDRDLFTGSFLVGAYYKGDDVKHLIAQRGVLDRWDRTVCPNCQFHRYVDLDFDLSEYTGMLSWPLYIKDFKVKVKYHDPAANVPAMYKSMNDIGDVKLKLHAVLTSKVLSG